MADLVKNMNASKRIKNAHYKRRSPMTLKEFARYEISSDGPDKEAAEVWLKNKKLGLHRLSISKAKKVKK